MVIGADVLFRLAANAAAQAWRTQPPYIAYHTVAQVDAPGMHRHKTVERAVEARTSDDYAVLQDLPQGQRQYGHSFPLIPTFDALSYFRLDYNAGRDTLAHVTMYAPITFSAPSATTPGVTVVATTLRNYYAQYAPDSTPERAHVLLEPLRALTTNNNSDFYLHDLYVDTATNLPTSVTYTGHDDIVFTVDYTVVDTHWLVSHASYTRAFFAPLHIGRTTVTVDATFDRFSFPARPEDAALLATPAPPGGIDPNEPPSTPLPSPGASTAPAAGAPAPAPSAASEKGSSAYP